MNTEEPVLKKQKLEDSEKEVVSLVPQSQVPQAKQHLYKTRYILKDHTKPVTCARFSPDGKLIATASADTTIRIWNAEDGRHLATLTGHLEGISDISWAPDSQIIASASDDKTIRLWNIHTNRMLRILTGHTHHVNSIDYNFKGNLIVSGAADENIRLWDVRQSKCLRILAAHSDPVTAVGFAPDGTIVVSASHDGLIRLWDTATGQCLKTLVSATKSPVMYVRFTPNGRYLLASTMDGCIRLWDYMKDKCAKTYLLRDETSDEDADINRPTNEFKYSSVSDFIIPSESGDKNDNADSEDATGPYIVQGMGKHSIGIWDVQKKQLVDELDDHSGPVLYVNVDTHSGRMVSTSMDGTVRIWQPTKRRDSQ